MCRHKVSCLLFAGVTSMDDLYSFSHDIKGTTFTNKPTSLRSFITFLENNSKVKVNLLMHKMVRDRTTKEWSVTPNRHCTFVVKPIDVSKKEKPSCQNAGSHIKVANLTDNWRIGAFMRWRWARSKSATHSKNPMLFYKTPVHGAWDDRGAGPRRLGETRLARASGQPSLENNRSIYISANRYQVLLDSYTLDDRKCSRNCRVEVHLSKEHD